MYVIGSKTEALNDEVLVLRTDGNPEAIVCAVPYLRDKDIRTVEPGETIDDKNAKLLQGLKNHYADVCDIAKQKQDEILKMLGIKVFPSLPCNTLYQVRQLLW